MHHNLPVHRVALPNDLQISRPCVNPVDTHVLIRVGFQLHFRVVRQKPVVQPVEGLLHAAYVTPGFHLCAGGPAVDDNLPRPVVAHGHVGGAEIRRPYPSCVNRKQLVFAARFVRNRYRKFAGGNIHIAGSHPERAPCADVHMVVANLNVTGFVPVLRGGHPVRGLVADFQLQVPERHAAVPCAVDVDYHIWITICKCIWYRKIEGSFEPLPRSRTGVEDLHGPPGMVERQRKRARCNRLVVIKGYGNRLAIQAVGRVLIRTFPGEQPRPGRPVRFRHISIAGAQQVVPSAYLHLAYRKGNFPRNRLNVRFSLRHPARQFVHLGLAGLGADGFRVLGDLGLHALLPGHKGRNGAVAADVQCRAHLLVDPRAVGCNLPVAQGNLLCNHRSGNGKLLLIQPCYSHTVQPEGDPVCRIGCKVLGHVHLFVGHAVNGNLGGFQVLAYGNAKDGHIVLVVSDNAAQDVPGRFYPIVVQRVNLALEIVAFHNPAGRSLDVLMYLLLVCAPLALCDVHAVQRRY